MFAMQKAKGKSGLSTLTMFAMLAFNRAWQIIVGQRNI